MHGQWCVHDVIAECQEEMIACKGQEKEAADSRGSTDGRPYYNKRRYRGRNKGKLDCVTAFQDKKDDQKLNLRQMSGKLKQI